RIRAVRASSLRVSRDRAVSLLDLAAAIHLAAAASARVGGGRGREDHAARVRCSSAAGLHPGTRRPLPLAGNESLRPLPPPTLTLAAVSRAGLEASRRNVPDSAAIVRSAVVLSASFCAARASRARRRKRGAVRRGGSGGGRWGGGAWGRWRGRAC